MPSFTDFGLADAQDRSRLEFDAMSSGFQDLVAWQKARELVKECYLLSGGLPKSEQFGISAQLQRAAVSVPPNIAEGSGRGSQREFVQFLRIAQGSLHEVETYLILLVDLEFASAQRVEDVQDLRRSVGRLLAALIKSMLPVAQNQKSST
ncbi:MAG TPA: four helix bundle protein [Fimbriimonadaceae bacterium]|nr:four helix bundle protein [Fimbriimonadaceae bacterium]